LRVLAIWATLLALALTAVIAFLVVRLWPVVVFGLGFLIVARSYRRTHDAHRTITLTILVAVGCALLPFGLWSSEGRGLALFVIPVEWIGWRLSNRLWRRPPTASVVNLPLNSPRTVR